MSASPPTALAQNALPAKTSRNCRGVTIAALSHRAGKSRTFPVTRYAAPLACEHSRKTSSSGSTQARTGSEGFTQYAVLLTASNVARIVSSVRRRRGRRSTSSDSAKMLPLTHIRIEPPSASKNTSAGGPRGWSNAESMIFVSRTTRIMRRCGGPAARRRFQPQSHPWTADRVQPLPH